MDNAPPAGETMTQVAERVRRCYTAMTPDPYEHTVLLATPRRAAAHPALPDSGSAAEFAMEAAMDNASTSEFAIYRQRRDPEL
jgi:hypothetical protein